MQNPIPKILSFFYQNLPIKDFGLAIFFLTFFFKLVFFPFEFYTFKLAEKMKKIQEKIKELKKIYGEDLEKTTKETLVLYSKERINPFFSIFFLLLQAPVFLAIFQTLKDISFPQANFLFIFDLSKPDPNLSGLALLSQFLLIEKITPLQILFSLIIFSFLISIPSSFSLFLFFNSVLTFIERSLFFKKWISEK